VLQAKIIADPGLERGDCIVESELGNVDGRLSVRLSELKRAVAATAADGGAA